MSTLGTLAVGTSCKAVGDHMTPLRQARVVGIVCLHVLLHVVLQLLDPGGLAELSGLFILRDQPVLEDVVDAEVGKVPVHSWSLLHDEGHVAESPAL